MTERPFNVLGIQQIAIGGLDKGALTGLWTGLLGVEKVGDYVAESENVDEDILRLGSGSHAVEIDLMQPIDPDRSPKVHSPALNHVGVSRPAVFARERRGTTCASSIRRATMSHPDQAKAS